MFSSLKEWLDVPITIKPFVKRTATGDKVFGETIQELCYPRGEVNIVRNWQGVEVVSHNHLHVEGDTQVTELDNIIFEGKEYAVQAISAYYRDGKPDIKVVYI